MAKPLRIEFGGALYRFTARGNGWRSIFFGSLDDDRRAFLFRWTCLPELGSRYTAQPIDWDHCSW